eukprot:3380034-Alexandrium_andersonii.AAC.1
MCPSSPAPRCAGPCRVGSGWQALGGRDGVALVERTRARGRRRSRLRGGGRGAGRERRRGR